jgi:hypothetical protein
MHSIVTRNDSHTRSRRQRPYKSEECEAVTERQGIQLLTTFCSLAQPFVCPMVLAKL